MPLRSCGLAASGFLSLLHCITLPLCLGIVSNSTIPFHIWNGSPFQLNNWHILLFYFLCIKKKIYQKKKKCLLVRPFLKVSASKFLFKLNFFLYLCKSIDAIHQRLQYIVTRVIKKKFVERRNKKKVCIFFFTYFFD